jgi:PTS system mannose-specific IID component
VSGPLPRGLLLRIALRSLLLQATWNFERMQHLGFCFALLPLIRRLHPAPGGAGRGEALKRHVTFFNTHPVMAAAILGAVARLEAEGQGAAAQTAKLALMGSYGAIGDSFFWGALRPLAGIAGIAAGLFWGVAGLPGGLDGGALVGAAVALALFNGPALALRAYGVFAGARLGIGVVRAIGRLRLPELAPRLRQAGAALLGLTAAPLVVVAAFGVAMAQAAAAGGRDAAYVSLAWPRGVGVGVAVVLAGTFGALWLFGRGVVPTRLAWVLAAVGVGGAAWLSLVR